MTSRLVRLFRRGPGLTPTEACVVCGEPFGDMVHEITHAGSRHLDCHPAAAAVAGAPEPWTIRPAADAFRDAIEAGRLSDRDALRPPYAAHAPYAQDFMYMGTTAGVDAFKHITTRQYLPQPDDADDDERESWPPDADLVIPQEE